jgi:hypothetical protein
MRVGDFESRYGHLSDLTDASVVFPSITKGSACLGEIRRECIDRSKDARIHLLSNPPWVRVRNAAWWEALLSG